MFLAEGFPVFLCTTNIHTIITKYSDTDELAQINRVEPSCLHAARAKQRQSYRMWGLISWFQPFPTASGHLLVRQCKTASWVAAFTPQRYLRQCPTASQTAISTLSPPPWKEPLLAIWAELQLNHTWKMPHQKCQLHLSLSHPVRMFQVCLLILNLNHRVTMHRIFLLQLNPSHLLGIPQVGPLNLQPSHTTKISDHAVST